MKSLEVLSIIGGHVDIELLNCNEYLAEENKILRERIKGRVLLTDAERIQLATLWNNLGKRALETIEPIFKPQTLIDWYRRLVAGKFDGTQQREKAGHRRTPAEVEALIVQMAKDNRSWGYSRIVGALKGLGISRSEETVAEILRRNGVPPAEERNREMRWADFIKSHQEVLCAGDFFTVEAVTDMGLVTFYVLFFMHLDTRQVHIAGITQSPDAAWMQQIARNLTSDSWGFLNGRKYLILDRDPKFSDAFRRVITDSGTEVLQLPARSPNLNSKVERWVRSVKTELLSKMIFFGEESLRRALAEYVDHYHQERAHQGIDNVIPFPGPEVGRPEGEVVCSERLGGLLRYYYRSAI